MAQDNFSCSVAQRRQKVGHLCKVFNLEIVSLGKGEVGDVTWGGEHTIQYTDDVLQNSTPETYVILLITVPPVNSIK